MQCCAPPHLFGPAQEFHSKLMGLYPNMTLRPELYGPTHVRMFDMWCLIELCFLKNFNKTYNSWFRCSIKDIRGLRFYDSYVRTIVRNGMHRTSRSLVGAIPMPSHASRRNMECHTLFFHFKKKIFCCHIFRGRTLILSFLSGELDRSMTNLRK